MFIRWLLKLGKALRSHEGDNPEGEDGGVAQLGERLPCTQKVIGSIPFTSTMHYESVW